MLDKQFLWPYHSKAAEGSGPPGDASGRSVSGRSAALSGHHCNFQFPNAAYVLQGAALVAVRNQQASLNILAAVVLQGAALVAVRTIRHS